MSRLNRIELPDETDVDHDNPLSAGGAGGGGIIEFGYNFFWYE